MRESGGVGHQDIKQQVMLETRAQDTSFLALTASLIICMTLDKAFCLLPVYH